MSGETETDAKNFIREMIIADREAGKHGGRVVTRFPPEPNGYLHIGHAKAISTDFGLAEEFGGICNLRFDDTNPVTEETEYVDSIQADIRWLGFDWGDNRYFASDYFEQLYQFAVELVTAGKAYVDSLSAEEIRAYRGNFYNKGKNSPYRDRSAEENLDLLARMKAGEFEDGAHVLRAKIDMESPNLNLRDPPMYRIKKAHHHRTGDDWCIYPIYDYAHPLSDAIEGITHSICTLEFEDHRPLYDWFVANTSVPHTPQQIEFARLSLSYTVMSKRKLLQLVQQGHVSGWDDPRMPTIAGLRRRGVTPEAIRRLCDRIGVAKRDNVVEVEMFEHAVREHLNETTPRVMGVLRPIKLVIENLPEGQTEWFEAPLHPEDPSHGSRQVPLSRELWIEREDFRETPHKKWFRFAPGQEVRLRYACLVTCTDVIKDDGGEVVELRGTWDPASRGGTSPDGRKVRGTVHWVSAAHAIDAEVRMYDRLFTTENPLSGDGDFLDHINPSSLEVLTGCKLEPHLATASQLDRFQFERLGYFCVDDDSAPGALVFNRTITLRDSWAKIEKQLT
jgi:glutaminyl-tRNA synthetase